MPLLPSALSSGLEAVAASPPTTTAECAADWATAISDYASAVVPPSSTVAAAATALEASLAGAFESPDAAAPMELAMATFALSVGGGMSGFVAVPPATPIGFAGLFGGPKPSTHAAAAAAVATLVDTWMRTGSATPSAGGSPVPWS